MSAVSPRPPDPHPSDAALMRRVQAGDASAFAELYDRHHEAAHRVASAICRRGDIAADALQEGFIAAWRGRDGYRPARSDVRGWLVAAVRERAIDLHRREATDVEAAAVAADEAERMRRLVGSLPVAQRDVIALAFFGELTHSEIAAHLGLPPATVKGRMRLGLRRLSAGLAEAA